MRAGRPAVSRPLQVLCFCAPAAVGASGASRYKEWPLDEALGFNGPVQWVVAGVDWDDRIWLCDRLCDGTEVRVWEA